MPSLLVPIIVELYFENSCDPIENSLVKMFSLFVSVFIAVSCHSDGFFFFLPNHFHNKPVSDDDDSSNTTPC